ncbi:type I restriction enzyme HsdR N-terminal domain-containing protein [Crocinitomix algicola]|uniref:type I restriction enzyme HsdR N-terminal domain-containing protein n=1 Tax=Crocinitomix algicola TaxID=1740263 RepID=UPI000830854D|nr:type I restriction enzyme HsdR N-terminal domain-containing protein [Crocinitomix algicola]
MYPPINLPDCNLKIKGNEIWDELRSKYIKNTPEEWVRQHFIHFMINHLNYPKGRMVSEYLVKYNGMNKRCDIAVFDENNKVCCIVECKAPMIKISEDTFYQIAKYTHTLKANYLILTNGMNHFCAYINTIENKMEYLEEIPAYTALKKVID